MRAPITVLHEQQCQETGGINVHVVATTMIGWRINHRCYRAIFSFSFSFFTEVFLDLSLGPLINLIKNDIAMKVTQ